MNHKYDLILGVHPSARGFGWILFERPLAPFDWGTVTIRKDRNAGALARIDRILRKYKPRLLAIEAAGGNESRRRPRIRRLCSAIEDRARERGVTVRAYSRHQVRQTFSGVDAQTREEIASAVADRVEALRSRLPAPRKIWLGEHPNMALFAAAACALTYFHRHG